MHHSTVLIYILALLEAAIAIFYYPSPQISLLEHIIVDNWGAYASNFSSAITPCTNYVTQTGEAALNSGRTSAAQWIRVIFHDFITANVSAGTGGVDASIGFETFREENKGSAFNDSFTFWRPFVNEYVPMSDLVALGTVMSVNLCGGKYIPYRPGRIDATSADPTTGVPEPGTGVEETLELFERAGLHQEDSIILTACGHTMGSVHHGGFPEVSPASAVTPNNTNGGVNFDSTRGVFDPLVVGEYLNGTGNLGGPLVSSFNETSRSDLRLYESDKNATMEKLYAQGDGFQDSCVEVMGQMMNTVPANVKLQDPISPMTIKPINVTWDFGPDDSLFLKGNIRVLWGTSTATSHVNLRFSNGYYLTLTSEAEGYSIFESTGTGDNKVFGITKYYPFQIAAEHLSGISSFEVSATYKAAATFPISHGAFIVPSLTHYANQTAYITVAVPSREASNLLGELSLTVAAPLPQPLTLAPTIQTSEATWSAGSIAKGEFVLRTALYEVGQTVTGGVNIKLLLREAIIDNLILDAGVAGW